LTERSLAKQLLLAGAILVQIALTAGCSDSGQAPSLAPAAELPPQPEEIVAPGIEWQLVAGGYVYSDAPAVNSVGEIYYSATTQNRIFHLNLDGEISLFDQDTQLTMGLMIGPDGRLYGCRNLDAQIVAYDMQGGREVLLQGEMTPLPDKPNAPGEFCNGLVINSKGQIWFTDRLNEQIIYLDSDGKPQKVAGGFRTNGIILSADETRLVVTDSIEPKLWAFAVQANGELVEIPDFFEPVKMVDNLSNAESARGRPGTNGMTVDSDGRFYVTSFYGIQVFDKDGAYVGVIHSPKGFRSNVTFGGKDMNILYASGVNALYSLETKVKGAPYFLRAK
jgi:gluconolactonase